MSMHVKEILKFKRSFLKRLKEDVDGDHSDSGTLCNSPTLPQERK
jgi:hypothetical protein